jgi:lactoylglutathione lyase
MISVFKQLSLFTASITLFINVAIQVKEVDMSIEINHVLVRTNDLKNMIHFLAQTVGLKEGFRPPFNFAGAWLYSDNKPLVHLTEINPVGKGQLDYLGNKASDSKVGSDVVDHIAFSMSDYPKLIARLKQQQIEYFERAVPLTGEHQVFAEGPDGLRIELLFDANNIAKS